MNHRKPLRELPENTYHCISKSNCSFCPQNNIDYHCQCQICHKDSYPPEIRKILKNQRAFLNHFNTNNLTSVIETFEELKSQQIELINKRKTLKDRYQKQIDGLQQQLQSSQNKIELLESTVKSLHSENDKMILIIESLRNENVIMCEKSMSEQLTRPQITPNSNLCLMKENQNLKQLVQNLDCEKQKLKNDNKYLEQEIQKITIENKNNEINAQKLLIEQENYKKLQIENDNHLKEIDQLKIENNQLRIEVQNQTISANNYILSNQKLQSEISKIKDEFYKLNKAEKDAQYSDNSPITLQQKSQETEQKIEKCRELEQKILKYQKQIEILKLNNKTLETENKALSISLNHHTVAKGLIKDLQRQNFKLEIEVEQLKMKNFKSPFKPELTTRPIQTSIISDNKMIDIGIITSFIEDKIDDQGSNLKEKYKNEKERRKQLAGLLSKIIKMFNSKCDQFLNDISIVIDSQNARIVNITKAIKQ